MTLNGGLTWFVGIALAVLLPLSGWAGKTLITHETKIAVQENESRHVKKALREINRKLDRLLGETPWEEEEDR